MGPKVEKSRWHPELVDLLDTLLAFSPAKLSSAEEALKHAYFAVWHDPEAEPVCERNIDWGLDAQEMSMATIRRSIYKLCRSRLTRCSGRRCTDANGFVFERTSNFATSEHTFCDATSKLEYVETV